MSTTTYRILGQGRKRLIAVVVLFVAAATAGSVTTIVASQPPWWIVLLYWVAVGWNSYWFLLRIAFRLDLDGDTLRWEAPLRNGTVRVGDIAEVRPQRIFGSSIAVIVTRDGSTIATMARRGFRGFTQALAEQVPGLPVRLSRAARLSERIPGPSSLRRPG